MKQVQMLSSCAGAGFNHSEGDVVEVTSENADVVESLVRGGLAFELTEESADDESAGVLPDQAAGAGNGKRNRKARGR